MHRLFPLCLPILLAMTMAGPSCSTQTPAPPTTEKSRKSGIVIHGGAGSPEAIKGREAELRVAMAEALTAGHRVLARGGTSLDAVQAAVVVLEDAPHLNAGQGAVFTHEGTNELYAVAWWGSTDSAALSCLLIRVA